MPPESSRTYNSPLRKEQAEETRRRIIEAAATAFIECGFSGTTMRQIAGRAEVSVERVYGEGTKAHLLVQAFRLRYTGEYDWDTILSSQWAQDLFAITDPQQGLDAAVEFLATAHARSANLWLILRATALSEPLVAREFESHLAFKRESWVHSVRWMAKLGIIPAASPDRLPALAVAANAISSAETYLHLTVDWLMSDAEYRDWLRHATTKTAELALDR